MHTDKNADTWLSYKPQKSDVGRMAAINGVTVERARIPEYLNEYYFSAVRIWNRYKRFGFPFDGGWAEQPAYIVEAIEVFDRLVDKDGS